MDETEAAEKCNGVFLGGRGVDPISTCACAVGHVLPQASTLISSI